MIYISVRLYTIMRLIVNYKLQIHNRKGKKNETIIITNLRDNKKECIDNKTYCCEKIKEAFSLGFISVETDQRNFANIKYSEKQIRLDEPVVCLNTFSDTGYSDEGCPHEESVLPINNCPFCQAEIEFICLEKKKIIHECVKKKRIYEECEDKTTEVIL